MDKRNARNTGLHRTIRSTIWSICVLELFSLIMETRGDFANGILFFLQGFLSLPNLIAIILFLVPSFLWGGRAGIDILVRGRKPMAVAFKYALISIALIDLVLLLLLLNSAIVPIEYRRQFLGIFILISVLAELCIWFLSAWRIKASTAKS